MTTWRPRVCGRSVLGNMGTWVGYSCSKWFSPSLTRVLNGVSTTVLWFPTILTEVYELLHLSQRTVIRQV